MVLARAGLLHLTAISTPNRAKPAVPALPVMSPGELFKIFLQAGPAASPRPPQVWETPSPHSAGVRFSVTCNQGNLEPTDGPAGVEGPADLNSPEQSHSSWCFLKAPRPSHTNQDGYYQKTQKRTSDGKDVE